jgi:hypothetical protein
MIVIIKPLYEGNIGKRSIGIPDFKLRNEGYFVEIKIEHKRKDGTYVYPNIYYIEKSKIGFYPTKEGTSRFGKFLLYIVPIADLKIKNAIESVEKI